MLIGCSPPDIPDSIFKGNDALVSAMETNISEAATLSHVIDIDHARLAKAAGQPFRPTEVVMFHDINLEQTLIQQHQLLALELPFKVLAYTSESGNAQVIWNSLEFIENKYGVTFNPEIHNEYNQSMSYVTKNIPSSDIQSFSSDTIDSDNITTLQSTYDFQDTLEKSLTAIKENSDVTVFKVIDYQKILSDQGVNIRPTTLIMFGAPAPGGKAMRKSQTLGLDVFPQKYLVYQQDNGSMAVSYNSLTAAADRQHVPKAIALHVIQYRLDKTFKKTFSAQ